MPQKVLTPEDVVHLQQQGVQAKVGDVADYEDAPVAAQSNDGAGSAAYHSFASSALPAAGGGVGFGTGMALGAALAPETGGLSLAIPLISGLVGAYGGSKIGQGVTQAVLSDAEKAQLAQEQVQHPIASAAGNIAAMPLGGLMPTPSSMMNTATGAGKLAGYGLGRLTGMGEAGAGSLQPVISMAEKQALINSAAGAGLAPIQTLAENAIEGRDTSGKELLQNAALGALFNSPTPGIGARMGFHGMPVRAVDSEAGFKQTYAQPEVANVEKPVYQAQGGAPVFSPQQQIELTTGMAAPERSARNSASAIAEAQKAGGIVTERSEVQPQVEKVQEQFLNKMKKKEIPQPATELEVEIQNEVKKQFKDLPPEAFSKRWNELLPQLEGVGLSGDSLATLQKEIFSPKGIKIDTETPIPGGNVGMFDPAKPDKIVIGKEAGPLIPAHEGFHEQWSRMTDEEKARWEKSSKGELAEVNKARVASDRAPYNPEEWFAIQGSVEHMHQGLNTAQETPFKKFVEDTKSVFKQQFGKDVDADTLLRAHNYRLMNEESRPQFFGGSRKEEKFAGKDEDFYTKDKQNQDANAREYKIHKRLDLEQADISTGKDKNIPPEFLKGYYDDIKSFLQRNNVDVSTEFDPAKAYDSVQSLINEGRDKSKSKFADKEANPRIEYERLQSFLRSKDVPFNDKMEAWKRLEELKNSFKDTNKGMPPDKESGDSVKFASPEENVEINPATGKPYSPRRARERAAQREAFGGELPDRGAKQYLQEDRVPFVERPLAEATQSAKNWNPDEVNDVKKSVNGLIKRRLAQKMLDALPANINKRDIYDNVLADIRERGIDKDETGQPNVGYTAWRRADSVLQRLLREEKGSEELTKTSLNEKIGDTATREDLTPAPEPESKLDVIPSNEVAAAPVRKQKAEAPSRQSAGVGESMTAGELLDKLDGYANNPKLEAIKDELDSMSPGATVDVEDIMQRHGLGDGKKFASEEENFKQKNARLNKDYFELHKDRIKSIADKIEKTSPGYTGGFGNSEGLAKWFASIERRSKVPMEKSFEDWSKSEGSGEIEEHFASPEENPGRKGFLKLLEPTFDRVEKVSPKLAEAGRRWEVQRDIYRGAANAALKDLHQYSDADVNRVAELHRAAFREGKIPELTGKQKDISDILSKYYYEAIGQERRDLGVQIDGRKAGMNKWYVPDTMNAESIDTLVNRPSSPEGKHIANQWRDWIVKHSDGKVEEKEAADYISNYREALGGKEGNYLSVKFGAIRKAEGYGLPPDLREKNATTALQRYGNRAAGDLAMYKELESKSEIAALLGLNDPATGKKAKMEGVDSLSSEKEVRDMMKWVTGDFLGGSFARVNPASSAFVRLVNNSLLGPATALRDTASVPVNMIPYIHRWSDLSAAMTGISKIRENSRRSLEVGAKQPNLDRKQFNDMVQSPDPTTEFLRKAASFARLLQGREHIENFNRDLTFSIGRELAKNNVLGAKAGDAKSIAWVKKFSTLLDEDVSKMKPGKDFESAIDIMAKNFTDRNQGTYGGRGLPVGIVDSQFSPFLALQKWSVEKSNTIYQDVMKPFLDGSNRIPLLTYTLGSIITGAAIQQLNKALSGRKGQDPEVKEAIAGRPADMVAELATLMQLGSYAGIVGDTMKALADPLIYGKTPRNMVSFPAATATLATAEKVTDVAEAIRQGDDPWEVLKKFSVDMMTDNVQAARMIANHTVKQDDLERSDKFRDYRVWQQMQGAPAEDMTKSNRYLGLESKAFKRTGEIGEAADALPALIDKMFAENADRPDKLKRDLENLKSNSYQTMPSIKKMPLAFQQYYEYLHQTQGADEADNRMMDFLQQGMVNKAKGRMVP